MKGEGRNATETRSRIRGDGARSGGARRRAVARAGDRGAAATPRVLRLNTSDTNDRVHRPGAELRLHRLASRVPHLRAAPVVSGQAGRRGRTARAGGRAGHAAGQQQRPDVHLHRSGGTSASPTGVRYAEELRPCDRAGPASQDAVSRGELRLEDILGADAVQAGRRTTPSGVVVNGDRLAISLIRPAPDFMLADLDGLLLRRPREPAHRPARSHRRPRGRPVLLRRVQRASSRSSCERNPYYGGKRPQRWDEVKVAQNVGVQTSYLQVRRGEIDLDMLGAPARRPDGADPQLRDQHVAATSSFPASSSSTSR